MYNELTKIKGGDEEAFIFHSTPGDNGRELKRSTARVIVLRADKIHEGPHNTNGCFLLRCQFI